MTGIVMYTCTYMYVDRQESMSCLQLLVAVYSKSHDIHVPSLIPRVYLTAAQKVCLHSCEQNLGIKGPKCK